MLALFLTGGTEAEFAKAEVRSRAHCIKPKCILHNSHLLINILKQKVVKTNVGFRLAFVLAVSTIEVEKIEQYFSVCILTSPIEMSLLNLYLFSEVS